MSRCDCAEVVVRRWVTRRWLCGGGGGMQMQVAWGESGGGWNASCTAVALPSLPSLQAPFRPSRVDWMLGVTHTPLPPFSWVWNKLLRPPR